MAIIGLVSGGAWLLRPEDNMRAKREGIFTTTKRGGTTRELEKDDSDNVKAGCWWREGTTTIGSEDNTRESLGM